MRTRMAVVPETQGGKAAATRVELEEALPAHSLIVCRLETGRTHQIRVHLQSVGHPLEGDTTYGARPWPNGSRWQIAVAGFARQALHARRLAFLHPATRQEVEFRSALPADFQALLTVLRQENP
jgi:23S rRNA pseudouridine1911/1915/1917 synthase